MSSESAESTLVLLERIRAGDRTALNLLLTQYRPLLTRWARGRLPQGVGDPSDAEDLVQETIIGVLRNLSRVEFRGEGALRAYLRRAVHNRVRDQLRRHRRRGVAETLDERLVCAQDSPFEHAIGREALERYESALSQLTTGERAAIVARIDRGQSFAEVARVLGKPTAEAARMAVNRALARLARLMQPRADDERLQRARQRVP